MSVLAVYDCMLYFAQASRPERVRETFDLIDNKLVTLFISAEVLAEIRDVLTRPEYRAKFPALAPEAVAAFLEDIAARATIVENVAPVYSVERDLKDSKYVNLALAAGAEFLVTRDRDLLDLMNESTAEGRDFRNRFPALRIVEPREFVLEALRRNPQ